MTLTFPYPVKADITDEMSLPSIVLSYGDGCKQRSPDGLNLPKTVWNIQCPLDSKAKAIALKAFLINVGNSIPFLWQSPLDTKPEFYYITGKIGGSYRLGGASKPDFFVRTMQFEYANIAIVSSIVIQPTFTPTVSVDSVASTGWVVSRTGSVSLPLIVNLTLTVTPISGTPTIVNKIVTIPILSSTVFVQLSGATGGRTETLTVNARTGYTIGSPATSTISFAAPPLVISIIGGTEATGFTISVTVAQPVNTIVYLSRSYAGIYTVFLNDSLTVTILAGSLSVNLPFGDRKTTAAFGNITVVIDVNSQSYISSNSTNTATISFP